VCIAETKIIYLSRRINYGNGLTKLWLKKKRKILGNLYEVMIREVRTDANVIEAAKFDID
jgi:hypothetical protein